MLLIVPSFDALSYCWGPGARSHKIHVLNTEHHGQSYILLTKSLMEALVYISRFWQTRQSEPSLSNSTPKYIWIDQIYINQGIDRDNEAIKAKALKEKDYQISIMGNIYRSATRVIVWLSCDLSYNASKILSHHVADGQDDTALQIENALQSPDNNPNAANAICFLSENKWFQRTWVVQEACLARECYPLIGFYRLNWSLIARLTLMETEIIDKHRNARYMGWHMAASVCWKSFPKDSDSLKDQALHFLQFMMCAQQLEVTEPRDRIMAYLGLWCPPSFNPITGGSTHEVYRRFTAAVIHDTKSLDILGAKRTLNYELKEDDKTSASIDTDRLPSWVSDWNSKNICWSICRVLTPGKEICQWSASDLREHSSSSLASEELQTQGKIVYIIEHLYPCIKAAESVRSIATLKTSLKSATRGDIIPLQEAVRIIYTYSSTKKILDHKEDGDPARTIEGLEYIQQNQQGEDLEGLSMELKRNFYQWKNVIPTAEGRRFMDAKSTVTGETEFGLVPCGAEVGDYIAILHGCRFPVVLRKAKQKSRYRFISDGYIENLMFGQGLYWEKEDADEIVLV